MIYDKAKYHFEGDFPLGISEDQAYVHEGMFLGWATVRNLLSHDLLSDFEDIIARFLRREIRPGKFFRLLGGVLADDMFSDSCNAFAAEYYLRRKDFFDDYAEIFPAQPSAYHVPDTWVNFQRVCERLDERFNQEDWTKRR